MTLCERFFGLLEQHVDKLTIRGQRASGLCPFHQERTPSFSAHLERLVWNCFGCGASGGVKRFAELVGEPWGSSHNESRAARAQRARFQAEQQARIILEQRAEERDKALCAKYRELYGEAIAAADLLALFWRRPDLAEEFSTLVVRTEQAYGEALFKLTVIEAKLNGEVAA